MLTQLIKRTYQPGSSETILHWALQHSPSKERLRDNDVKGGKAVCAHATTLDPSIKAFRSAL